MYQGSTLCLKKSNFVFADTVLATDFYSVTLAVKLTQQHSLLAEFDVNGVLYKYTNFIDNLQHGRELGSKLGPWFV